GRVRVQELLQVGRSAVTGPGHGVAGDHQQDKRDREARHHRDYPRWSARRGAAAASHRHLVGGPGDPHPGGVCLPGALGAPVRGQRRSLQPAGPAVHRLRPLRGRRPDGAADGRHRERAQQAPPPVKRAEPIGAHLVGSVPLASAEEVFRTVAGSLADRVRRIPDGETGPRADWIVWQYPVLSSRPQFEVGPPGPDHYRPLPRLQLKPGTPASELTFDSLGYAEAARSSYTVFARLKREGLIPPECRFQVSLPTPLAPISAFVAPADQAAVEPRYEARMLAELDEILAVVPADQLAVQWDTNFEFGMLEGVFPAWFADVRAGVLERLLRLGRQVPRGVELGYHLCYGDAGHRHFKDPDDARLLAEMAAALASGIGRPLDWVHMPVPRDRVDSAYFAPLSGLRMDVGTELYLGLVHL